MSLKNPSTPVDDVATSESEEMYLIRIAMAIEGGAEGSVPVKTLADALSVTPVSANQMIRKLEGRELVSYAPYHGVDLTDTGRRVATRVLRGRRLWSVFLTDRLGFSDGEAEAIACELEHVTPGELADRLAGFLDDPRADQAGRPIPDPDADPSPASPLDHLPVGSSAVVAAVDDVGGFLDHHGVRVGCELTVLAAADNGTMLIGTPAGGLYLADEMAARVMVTEETR